MISLYGETLTAKQAAQEIIREALVGVVVWEFDTSVRQEIADNTTKKEKQAVQDQLHKLTDQMIHDLR